MISGQLAHAPLSQRASGQNFEIAILFKIIQRSDDYASWVDTYICLSLLKQIWQWKGYERIDEQGRGCNLTKMAKNGLI